MTTSRFRTAVILALLAFSSGTVHADSVHRQIQKHVPNIVDYLRNKGIQTVGVLKFRVAKPGDKLTDSAGPVNSLLADRLEVGLILANSFDETKQIQVIKDASSQAAKVDGANHLTTEGRKIIFDSSYKLAWGDKTARADAFLTGIIQVHDNNRTASIGILCFDKNGSKLERACDVFEAELDASTLGELGESFILRGAFDGGDSELTFEDRQQQRQKRVVEQAKQVKAKTTAFPLSDSAAPMKLEVLFDGSRVDVETRNGRAFIPEPVTGQKVEFALVRGSRAQGRLGVLLKVNGENTLYRETNRDIDCSKWILSPEHKKTLVRGYQSADGKTAEKFTVLSRSESAKRAIDYGRNVGQIQLTVFQEITGPKPTPALLDEDEEDLIAMLRGVQPEKTPQNLSALKRQVRTIGLEGLRTRGLIVQGEKTDNAIRVVTFEPDPTPIMSVTITYYKP